MKKIFRHIIIFIIATFIALPAWAVGLQGQSIALPFSPLDLGDRLIQWQHARGAINFNLNGSAGDLVDDDFHTNTDPPTGGTRSGDAHVVSGELVSITAAGSESNIRYDVGDHTEMWFEADITIDEGGIIDETSPFGFDQRTFAGARSTGVKYMLKVRKEGANAQFSFFYDLDSGSVTTHIKPFIVLGQTYRIAFHWKKETGAGLGDSEFQAWINGVQVIDDSGYADFGVTLPDDFYIGNWFTAAGSTYTSRVDNVKMGVNGSAPVKVTKWIDRSVKYNDLVQATESKQPTYDILGSCVVFDGINDILATLAYSSPIGQPNTIFVAYQMVLEEPSVYVFDGITATDRHAISSSGTTGFHANAGTTGAIGGVNDTGKHIVIVEFNNTNSNFWLDGGAVTINDGFGTHFLTGLTLASRNTDSQWAYIKITEVIVVDDILTPAEKNQIGQYLSANNPGFVWADIN